MRALIPLLMLIGLVGCSSTPTVFPEEKGVTCYQTEEQEAKELRTCLRVNSYSDPVKWHRVKKWHVLPEIPDLD